MARIVSFICFLFICILSYGRNVSLYDYGLNDAKSDEDRFWVLYNAHVDAVKNSCTVNYSDIHSLTIEIPSDAKSIPITHYTNFNGLTLTVKNLKKRDFVLFVMENTPKKIDIDKKFFKDLNFCKYAELKMGTVLLIVHDETPWVENRIGHDYGATRYDILLLKNGYSKNRPVQTYYNSISVPKCSYVKVTNRKKIFQNIIFRRGKESTMKTFLLGVKNENNIEIKNIQIVTPRNETLYGDHVISIDNCTNVVLKKINVNNTYSKTNLFGYAFALFNVWNTKRIEVVATADWGVFGNNNVNFATISNCNINRFDLHCYGKDFFLKNCIITSGIPVGSFYGTLSFKKCTFKQGQPCIYRNDYNAYMPFSLELEKCSIEMNNKRHSFLYITQLSKDQNSRVELQRKYLPNIKVKDCTVILKDGRSSFDIVYIGKNDYPLPIGGVENIKIDGLAVEGKCDEMRLITSQITTESPVEVIMNNVRFDNNSYPRIVVNLIDGQGHPANVKKSKR